jgi:5-methylcytosine-specific restriction endonuclease McrA
MRRRLLITKRAEFSKRTRLEAFVRAGGRCEHYENGKRCEAVFKAGAVPHYDHIIAASNGGGNSLDNCAVICRAHHREKTVRIDVPRAAKSERLYQKNVAGIR